MTTTPTKPDVPESSAQSLDFIRQKVQDDTQSGRFEGRVVTRFPPEPNGFLHIGHAKAFCLNFGVAEEFGGHCTLRFDDTNPIKEEQKFIDVIQEDVRWLGWDWGEHLRFASDYFDQLYDWAVMLIKAGKAYVDDQSVDQVRESRGTLTAPGVDSPFRDRPVDEILDLFARMKAGEFADGQRVLRAKIDMASPNINLRDPVLYRIVHAAHPRTGTNWCIYPMYDWAHGQSDWIEGVTHSLCDTSFEIHRPLYDWCLDTLVEIGAEPPLKVRRSEQTEFARVNITHTVLSKRYLRELVENDNVSSWDDPRMPTLCGMRRRGYTPEAIREFCTRIGIAKRENLVEIELLEHCLREHLNKVAPRAMAVLDPIRVIIDNYPDDPDHVDELDAVNNPEDEAAGTRKTPFARKLYIERDDFMIDPPRKFFRLAPGREVRLRYAYFITCNDYVTDDAGNVTALHCTYDPATRGGTAPDGRKVKGTIHWVSEVHALDARVRLFEHLFTPQDPADILASDDWHEHLNPESLTERAGCKVEPSLAGAAVGDRFQFERLGYFCVDSDTVSGAVPGAVPGAAADMLVFNRTVTLRDSWSKVKKKS